jgi:hypothetical protein
MAEGRNRRLWDHTATVAAAALSSFREKVIDPARLHPYERGGGRGHGGRGIPLTAENITILKALVPSAGRSQS